MSPSSLSWWLRVNWAPLRRARAVNTPKYHHRDHVKRFEGLLFSPGVEFMIAALWRYAIMTHIEGHWEPHLCGFCNTIYAYIAHVIFSIYLTVVFLLLQRQAGCARRSTPGPEKYDLNVIHEEDERAWCQEGWCSQSICIPYNFLRIRRWIDWSALPAPNIAQGSQNGGSLIKILEEHVAIQFISPRRTILCVYQPY